MPFKDINKKREYLIKNRNRISLYWKIYNLKNKEKISIRNREYLLKNRDRILLRKKKYYTVNNGKMLTQAKLYRLKNKEKISQSNRKHYASNKEEVKLRRKQYYYDNKVKEANRAKVYYLKNKKKLNIERNKYAKAKRLIDPRFKLRCYFSSIISDRLHSRLSSKNGKSTFSFLPYTLEQLISHLEKQFKDGMTWQNYGKWHIDHVKPDSLFNYKSVDDKEFQECWALDNLQPLWAHDNLSKSNKYN